CTLFSLLMLILFASISYYARSCGFEENLFYQVKETMNDIYRQGGRNTESDLFGENGKYTACLSKDTAGKACPRCGETIVKENYLGGSIYYCRGCQILE
ncbi:hypothetical protein ABHZ70_25185, partial [Bacteroides thetaiotaomicron]